MYLSCPHKFVELMLVLCSRIDKVPEVDIMDDMRLNAIFPLLLTRAILPQLRKVPGPTEIVYTGSRSGDVPIPTVTPYSAAKAFLKQLSAIIRADETFRHPSNVNTMCLNIGNVISSSYKPEPSIFTPTAEVFGKHVVARIGCGRPVVFPYMFHALQAFITDLIPAAVLEREVRAEMEKQYKAWKKD